MDNKLIPITSCIFFILAASLIIVGSSILFEYLTYKQYFDEGYKVTWSLDKGCEIQMTQQDSSLSWEHCNKIGDTYSVKNWAVRREE